MVSLKILVLMALIVAVACEPCHLKLRHKPRHKRCKIGTTIATKRGLIGGLGFLFKGLGRHCKIHKRLYNDLIDIRVPTDIDTTLSFILKLGLGSCSGINIWIPGLGDLLSRLIGLAIRLIVCFLGVLGDRSFCGGDYYQNYLGISIGGIVNIDILFDRFNVRSARDEFNEYIDKASNGRGISFFKGSRRTMINIGDRIVTLIEKKKRCSKADLTELIDCIITMCLTMSNSYSKDLGTQISEETITSINTYLVKSGCPSLSSRKTKIDKTIDEANEDNDSPWGNLEEPDDDDSNNSGDDSNAGGGDDDDNKNKNNDDDDKKKKKDNDDDDDKKKKRKNDDDDDDKKKKKRKDDDDDDDKKKKRKNDDDDDDKKKKRKNDDDDDDKKKKNDDNDGGDGGNKKNDGGDNSVGDVTPTTPLTKDIYILLKPVINKRGRTRVSPDVIRALIQIEGINSFSDVAKFITNLAVVIGCILDTLLKGLGELVAKIVIAITVDTVCNQGKGNDDYCSRDFGSIYGVNLDAKDYAGLKDQLKLGSAYDQAIKLINSKTSGKGKKAVSLKSHKIVLTIVENLAKECDNYNSASLSQIYKYITTLIASIANSFDKEHKLGDRITNNMASSCDKYIKQEGYETITDNKSQIEKSVQESKTDSSFSYVLTTKKVVTITETTEQMMVMSNSTTTTQN